MDRRSGLLAVLAITASVLTGCARPSYDEVEAAYANPPAGQGRIYFYQPSNAGSPVTGSPYVRLNGAKAGRTTAGEFFFVNRIPGKYAVKIEFSSAAPLTFDLAAGQIRYIRVDKDGNGLTFHEEPKDKAEAAMASMSYHGASSKERRGIKRAYSASQGNQAPQSSPAPQ